MSDVLSAARMKQAREELAAADRRLAVWMDRIGPLRLKRPASYFSTLCESIISQQLSAKAAKTIIRRTFALCADPRLPQPGELHALCRDTQGIEKLRAAGLSAQKLSYLEDLSRTFTNGRLRRFPFGRASDEEVIEALTAVKGIGLWTAEMFLIFGLRRPDVYSSGDLALRNGLMRVAGKQDLTPAQCETYALRWKPFRTVASMYLWKVAHWE